MYHIPKDKRAYRSVNKICDGLLDKLKTKKFIDVTVTEVQKSSGVGRATFYRLFDSTTDVLSYLCDKIFIEAEQDFAKLNSRTADKTTLCFIEKCMENKTLLTAIIESNRIDFLHDAHKKFFTSSQNYFFPKLTQEELNYMAGTLTAYTCAFIVAWLQNGGKETPKELQAKLKLCFNSLGKIFQ